mgnify:CR=1 FL=1
MFKTFNVQVSSCKIFLSYFEREAFSLKELLDFRVKLSAETDFKDVNSGKACFLFLAKLSGLII